VGENQDEGLKAVAGLFDQWNAALATGDPEKVADMCVGPWGGVFSAWLCAVGRRAAHHLERDLTCMASPCYCCSCLHA
jgi:hypothetical protein